MYKKMIGWKRGKVVNFGRISCWWFIERTRCRSCHDPLYSPRPLSCRGKEYSYFRLPHRQDLMSPQKISLPLFCDTTGLQFWRGISLSSPIHPSTFLMSPVHHSMNLCTLWFQSVDLVLFPFDVERVYLMGQPNSLLAHILVIHRQ